MMFPDLGKFFLPDKNYPKKLNPEGLSRKGVLKVSNQFGQPIRLPAFVLYRNKGWKHYFGF